MSGQGHKIKIYEENLNIGPEAPDRWEPHWDVEEAQEPIRT